MEQRLPVLVRQGIKFPPRYVEMLTEQIGDLVTLTDQDDTPGKTRLLKCNYKGWTSKMELFAPWNEDLRPCLFVDLDTIVLYDISDILEMEVNDLWLIRDFYNPERSNSGMMLIPKDTNHIWADKQCFNAQDFRDGDYLNNFPHKVLQDRFEGIKSYKADNLQDNPLGRVVCFHGFPKPHECGGWVKEIYEKSS